MEEEAVEEVEQASMNKSLYIVIAFFIIALILAIVCPLNTQFKNYKKINYPLYGRTYHLIVADSEEKMVKGLMYVKQLKGYDGMIFTFNAKDYRMFWNKNTLLNLNLYWIDGKNVVGISELPSIIKTHDPFTVQSPEPVDTVVELVRGH